MKVSINCAVCGNPFMARRDKVESGIAKCCSSSCNSKRTASLRTPVSLRLRFDDKVIPEPNSGCWLWTGSIDGNGYGQIRLGGTGTRLLKATHVALLLNGTPIPQGLNACHKCDNPSCVNPDHLFIGTQAENIRDCIGKGRHKSPPVFKGPMVKRSFCKHGHEFTLENTHNYLSRGRPARACKACFVVRSRAYLAALHNRGLTARGTVPKAISK